MKELNDFLDTVYDVCSKIATICFAHPSTLLKLNMKDFYKDTYRLGDSERSDKRYALVKELKKERDDKIAQIILDLELGETTKKELNDILANVNF